MTSHDNLRDELIESDRPPNGKGWVNVPVGFQEKNISEDMSDSMREDLKQIDAVCLTNRDDSGPLVPSEMYTYRELREEYEFESEDAVLVEVKPNGPNFKGIGQLMAYTELFEEDWKGIVTDRLLLVDGVSEITGHAVNKMDDVELVYHHEL